MEGTKTLTETGKCQCGSKSFVVLEHVYTSAKLENGILAQSKLIESEFENAACVACGAMYEHYAIGEIRLLPIGT